ncbi:hypothetical protein Ga0100230_019015 [Opitutaceae bacterium TAV3]|nr:hypothetical protein Ga0100230_019015 [Opitutaceae bacterium TAV3]
MNACARSLRHFFRLYGRIVLLTGALTFVLPTQQPGLVAADGANRKNGPLVDRFGQFLHEDWPGKITSGNDLRRDFANERARLADVRRDESRFDRYGGVKDPSRKRKATGFFRLEKIDARWWFITPEGNPWLMSAVSADSPWEWGYATSLHTRDGKPRDVFAALPDKQTHPAAYIHDPQNNDQRVNFLLADLTDKYGPDFGAAWTELTRKRLLAWGINSNAKWARSPLLAQPYVDVLRPGPGTRRITYAADPWDSAFARNVEAGVAQHFAPNQNQDPNPGPRDDPFLIGHTFESEQGWGYDVFEEMLKLGPDSPAKRAFVDFLFARFRGDTAALAKALGLPPSPSAESVTRDALLARSLIFSERLRDAAAAFILETSRRYYSVVASVVRRFDPNHLLLGSSLGDDWHGSYEFIIGAVGFLDALSFDHYRHDPSWIKPYLKHDTPILLLEYSITHAGRGMPGAFTQVSSQRERGTYYRHLIEQLASTPQFVGASWFSFYDQPVTGREPGGGGESHNFGLINQQDQPYEDMLDEMKKTTSRLHAVHAGVTPPFAHPKLIPLKKP